MKRLKLFAVFNLENGQRQNSKYDLSGDALGKRSRPVKPERGQKFVLKGK